MSEQGELNHDEHNEDTREEMRQLLAIAQDIDSAQTLPPTPEEESAQQEAQRVEDINNHAVALADEQYLAAVSSGVDALWSLAAPNWKLEEAELAPMAQLTKMVIDKHFPNLTENAGPEVMLGMIALTVVTSRVSAGIPPRGPLKVQGGDDEQS